MNQLSLFETPAATRAPRPDTAMLLAMDAAYTVGAAYGDALPPLEPNQHGIWPSERAENLILPRQRKDWRGEPIAQIDLLQTPRGWLAASHYNLDGFSGGGQSLSPKWHGGFLPSRAVALAHAIASLRQRVTDKKSEAHKDAIAINKWLDYLEALG